MRLFYRVFWVALPTCLYGLYWTVWSFVLQRPVPIVGKFLWSSGKALQKLMPNLQNPYDQFIYFPTASRWWDVALAPIGALVLVLLYYNKTFNDEFLSYEDMNFSWRKMLRDITNPFLRPYYVWREGRQKVSLDALRRLNERMEQEHMQMFYPRLEGMKTMMAYCVVICFFFGILFGLAVGPAKGPFGFFGTMPFLACLFGPLMLITRRWQIAVMTHISCWVGMWYGFSVGIGMIPALYWTSYMFIPPGLVAIAIYRFRSSRKSEPVPAL